MLVSVVDVKAVVVVCSVVEVKTVVVLFVAAVDV